MAHFDRSMEWLRAGALVTPRMHRCADTFARCWGL